MGMSVSGDHYSASHMVSSTFKIAAFLYHFAVLVNKLLI